MDSTFTSKKLVGLINKDIEVLNASGVPVIFFITGTFSSGKTFFSKKLFTKVGFTQVVNLGVVAKAIRYFRPEISMTPKDGAFFAKKEWSDINNGIISLIVESYKRDGVNALVEGVQVDTDWLSQDNSILGGVILEVDTSRAEKRGNRPATHFAREARGIQKIIYETNAKFVSVDNNGSVSTTYTSILSHLLTLLERRVSLLYS